MLGPNVENKMTVMDNEDPADPSRHEPQVTGAPEAIWLVYGDLDDDATHAECADRGEVTWCEDAQFTADVRYLRADLLYHQAREIAAQEAAAEIGRLRAALGSIHWRVARSDTAFDDVAAAVLAEVCEQACPELRALGPNVISTNTE